MSCRNESEIGQFYTRPQRMSTWEWMDDQMVESQRIESDASDFHPESLTILFGLIRLDSIQHKYSLQHVQNKKGEKCNPSGDDP